jgi:hypothetical protein
MYMPRQSILTKSQIADLGLIQGLSDRDFTRILKRLKAVKQPPLGPSGLNDLIRSALPTDRQATGSNIVVDTLTGVLLGIGGPLVRGLVDLEGYFDAISSDLEAEWGSEPSKIERWNQIRPLLVEMLRADAVRTTVKALDVSYEYANLLQSCRIMTDVRPIYDDEGDEIEGAVVSFTLRLNLLNAGQPKSLSIAIDGIDLHILLDQCQRALRKAETARRRFLAKDIGIPIKIVGMEEERDGE